MEADKIPEAVSLVASLVVALVSIFKKKKLKP